MLSTRLRKKTHINVLRMSKHSFMVTSGRKADSGKQLSEQLPKKSPQKPEVELEQTAIVQSVKMTK